VTPNSIVQSATFSWTWLAMEQFVGLPDLSWLFIVLAFVWEVLQVWRFDLKSWWAAAFGASVPPIPVHNSAPTPDRDVVDQKSALSQEFFHIAVGKREAQIPANGQ
jgi:hypothetical protein